LDPLRATSGPLADALDEKHSDTCEWVYDVSQYIEWDTSPTSSILCLTGQPGELYCDPIIPLKAD